MEKVVNFDQERRRLTRWACGVTVAYVAILTVLAALVVFGEEGVNSFREMSPNEVGDLLAGIAGPFALIWLVYGYFLQGIAIRQQAEELAQNTRALHLQEEALRAQVSELNASVEQQRQLVEISRVDLEKTIEEIRLQNQRYELSIAPNLIVKFIGDFHRSYEDKVRETTAQKNFPSAPAIGPDRVLAIEVKNIGAPARSVTIESPFFTVLATLKNFRGDLYLQESYLDASYQQESILREMMGLREAADREKTITLGFEFDLIEMNSSYFLAIRVNEDVFQKALEDQNPDFWMKLRHIDSLGRNRVRTIKVELEYSERSARGRWSFLLKRFVSQDD